MIIGLTGKFAAGKGTVADYLQRLGYAYHSLSDVLRDYLKEAGIPESREALTTAGNALRAKHGPPALAVEIRPRLLTGDKHIVDSIRNPAEVDTLRTLPRFVMIGVDADPEIRFARLRARNRQGDPTTFEAFTELEARETYATDPKSQRLQATWEKADHIVMNNGSITELEDAVAQILARLSP